jgi:dTDP-4-amino-4,6-dideoxygalactose transaminase
VTTSTQIPAILAGTPRELIADPRASLLGDAERAALLSAFDDVVARGGREGDEVEVFERAFAARLGAAHTVAVSSATTGIQLLLTALGVGRGDEVLVPAHTFPATAHAVVHAGAVPVFVDVEPDTLCLDPHQIAAAASTRCRAVLPVHIGGKPARMDQILASARSGGLAVVEDAAQAHGARYRHRSVGTFGDGGVFSFSSKLMTSFRGGAIVTDDDELAEECRRWRFHGFESARRRGHDGAGPTTRFVHHLPGYSAMMTPLQAALLGPQLDRLAASCSTRASNGRRLARALAESGGFEPILGDPDGEGNFYMLEAYYRPDGFAGLSREELVESLAWEGVPVSAIPLAHMLAYDNPSLHRYASACPNAERAALTLVIFGHPLQSLVLSGRTEYVDRVIERIAFVQRHAEEIRDRLASRTA